VCEQENFDPAEDLRIMTDQVKHIKKVREWIVHPTMAKPGKVTKLDWKSSVLPPWLSEAERDLISPKRKPGGATVFDLDLNPDLQSA